MVKRSGAVSGEEELVAKIRGLAALQGAPEVIAGIGDDCAIFRPRGGTEDLLFTTDMLLEDVHFRRDTHRPEDIGWKALARGLSDIAAMGGWPRFCLLSLAVPAWADHRWVERFWRGLLRLAHREETALIGGDLARSQKAMCDIVVCGAVPRGKALRRDRARPGDGVYVSGALGGSALGLSRGRGTAWTRHVHPEPRLALGRFLRERLGATAAMDLSDGLSLDLRRLCRASNLAAEISAPPLYRGASREQSLHGGEDYELLFTLPARTKVPPAFDRLPLTRIGTVVRGEVGTVKLDGEPLAALAWDHFGKPEHQP